MRVTLRKARARETIFASLRLCWGAGRGRTRLRWERDAAGRGCAGRLDAAAEALLVGWTDRAAHLKRMRELTELKQQGTMVDTLLADHGLYHLEADLRWIDHTAARLDQLAEALRG